MAIVFRPAARPVPVQIRWSVRRDMPEVLAIESGTDDPWGEDALLELLRRRDTLGMVAERGDQVVGHMIYRLRKDRLELPRIAVHPDHRRMGVFRQMSKKLCSKLHPLRRLRVVAHVDEHNLPLLLAMRSCGWIATELERGHFLDADAIRMELPIGAFGAE